MAHGFLTPTAVSGRSELLGMIASAIGSRIKKSSDMARKERAYASKQAENQGTSLEEAGIGKGYFFKRALGSSFGGDRIARTRGRFESDPPAGRDPTGTQASRFRGGFDYNVRNTINPPTGGVFSKGVSDFLGSGSQAINPEILGGELARYQGTKRKSSGFTAVDTTATEIKDIVNTLNQIGQLIVKTSNSTITAVDNVQQVNVRVVESIQSLGKLQSAIADRQMKQQLMLSEKNDQNTERLMLRAAARDEEAALEQGNDLSGFMTPENFAKKKKQEKKKEEGSKLKEFFRGPNPFKKDDGCGCSPIFGGPPGTQGRGGALAIPDYVERKRDTMRRPGRPGRTGGASIMRRGGGARALTRAATRFGGKGLGKAVSKGLAKKIPGVGVLAGGAFAAERAMRGDWLGAGGELLSGVASIIPGLGTAVSTGIDAGLAARDAGLTPFASGGIITQPTAGLVGEAGDEGIFPLEGKRGEKTFRMFGEGIFQAQKDNDKEYAELQSKGLKQYYEREGGFKKMGDIFGKIFGALGQGLGALVNSLTGAANAATNGFGGGLVDPTISGDEEEYLMRLMIAEAGGEGEVGMAAVGRSVLNRAGLIQSGEVRPGMFNAKSGSIMDVINASGQYQPVREGKLKRDLSPEERARAKKALEMARNQASLRGNLEAQGMSSGDINKIMASTGFRTKNAFYDKSQEVNVTTLGAHRFNTAGNAKMLTPGAVKMNTGMRAGTGMATFGETGRVFNKAGYVHGHFQTNTGSKADLVNDVTPIVKGLLSSGVTDVSITSGETFTANMSDAEIKGLIERGIAKHSHSGDGRSVDIFVPKGTKVPFPLSDVRNTGGNGGITGILPGSGKVWVGHLDPNSKSGGKLPAHSPNEPNMAGANTPGPQASAAGSYNIPGAPELSNVLNAANPNTGTPMMASSQQVAMASVAGGGAAPTIINNYYGGGGQSGGINPNGVSAGIGMKDTGTDPFQELRLRALA